jgi:hypothetical protein
VLFLPISPQSIDDLSAIEDQEGIQGFATGLTVAEIAALLVIGRIATLERPTPGATVGYHARIEKLLAAVITTLNQQPPDVVSTEFCQHHDREGFTAGRRHLEEDGIFPMPVDEVAEQAYIDPQGQWIWSYDQRRLSHLTPNRVLQGSLPREFGLTDEQHRTLYAISADPEQSLDISGYAGCGKTLMISLLPELIPKDTSLYLTLHEGQRTSMARRLPTGTHTTTFAELARTILQTEGLLGTDAVTMARITRPVEALPERLIAEIGIHAIADATPMEVLRCVNQTVARYCDSQHPGIRTAHIPRRYALFSSTERQIITSLAKKLWARTTGPDAADWLPLKDYHLIKMLALAGLPIPETTTHLIIDESHDLPKSVIEIIDRGSQTVITLGDRYQALSYHRTATKQRGQGISIREMAYSVRAGNNIADTVNNICAFHPVQYSQPFQGSQEKRTRLVYYSDFRIPDNSCAILVKSGFYLFSIMQRLSVSGARFHLLRGDDLMHLMSDAVNLFSQNTRATHRDLYQYANWGEFMQAQCDPVIEKIDGLFRRGYGMTHLQEAMARAEARYHPDYYVIGRIEDARNREFPRVVLLSDVLRPEGRTKAEIGHFINTIYTGLSRAQNEIILPEDFEGRIVETLVQS